MELKSSHETQNMNENSGDGQIASDFWKHYYYYKTIQGETSEGEKTKVLICCICFIATQLSSFIGLGPLTLDALRTRSQ